MIQTKTVKLGDREIVVKELSAEQVESLVRGFDPSREAHIAEVLMDSPISIEVVALSAGLSAADLGRLTPSALKIVWDAVAEVNDFLSAMLARSLTRAGSTTLTPSAGQSAG